MPNLANLVCTRLFTVPGSSDDLSTLRPLVCLRLGGRLPVLTVDDREALVTLWLGSSSKLCVETGSSVFRFLSEYIYTARFLSPRRPVFTVDVERAISSWSSAAAGSAGPAAVGLHSAEEVAARRSSVVESNWVVAVEEERPMEIRNDPSEWRRETESVDCGFMMRLISLGESVDARCATRREWLTLVTLRVEFPRLCVYVPRLVLLGTLMLSAYAENEQRNKQHNTLKKYNGTHD